MKFFQKRQNRFNGFDPGLEAAQHIFTFSSKKEKNFFVTSAYEEFSYRRATGSVDGIHLSLLREPQF